MTFSTLEYSATLLSTCLFLVAMGCDAGNHNTSSESRAIAAGQTNALEDSLRNDLGLTSSDSLNIMRTGVAFSIIHNENIEYAWVYTQGSAGHRLLCPMRERQPEARWKIPDISIPEPMGDQDPFFKQFSDAPSDEDLEAFVAYCDALPLLSPSK
ncbi:hypothetical protein [Rhodopirellula europaea]|nr:hypothetical protein [Rhodopirellula europaea]